MSLKMSASSFSTFRESSSLPECPARSGPVKLLASVYARSDFVHYHLLRPSF
jgi:hypothetical protein